MMTGIVSLPARLLVFVLAGGVIYAAGWLAGDRHAGQAHLDYVAAQAKAAQRIAVARQKVVTETQIKYVDRVRTIIQKGEVIEKQIPVYVTQSDNDRCVINDGFVRVFDSAWQNIDPGPSGGTDRESAGIQLSDVAQVNAENATICLAWREQALTLRKLYQQLQKVTNQ